MTSTADMTQHPDVSEIADLSEGLLPASRASEVQQHLEACSLCADVRYSLQEIQELLATPPTPVHMPTDIADRIDAALAEESVREALATPQEGGAHVSRETSLASLASQEPEPSHGKRPAGRPRAASGPGRGRTVRRRHIAAVSAAFGAAVIGMGVFFLQSSPSTSSGDTSAAEKTSQRGGTPAFADGALQRRVHSLLASTATTSSKPTPQEKKKPSVHMDSSPTLKNGLDVIVPSCIAKGIGREVSPLAAQKGTYKGSDAFLVVLPHPTDSTRVQAYVVDAACVDATPSAPGKVLLTHVYPRS
ncbi:anti-sigma factor family protein [Streptomyces sp. NBC_00859]|uniref:anti-sigma factor family protein n=1 Tax=Streptomyces sp. NBC_00859 TaxID=2903682 RepID=UPI0038701074|nr:hypothetical protein OG584_17190 [Streptomyces sp. NBC_00859]